MKKFLSALILIGFLSLPMTPLFAQELPPEGTKNIIEIMTNIFKWIFGLFLVVAAFFLVIAGYYFVTAAGDPEKVKTARNYVLWALVGVLVAVLSRGLVYAVQQIIK